MKKAKIINIYYITPFENTYGTTYYHKLELDNGDKIEIGKKGELQTGWEVIYQIVDQDGKSEYVKAKSVSLQDYNNANPNEEIKPKQASTTQYKADPLKQASIEMQVCLKESLTFHNLVGFEKSLIEDRAKEICATAEYFYNELLK